MQNFFRLNRDATEFLAEKYGTPLLVLSLNQLKANYQFLIDNLPGVKVHYAVKSNPDRRLVQALDACGCYFDAASDGEILQLVDQGISPDRIIYANTVKTDKGLAAAQKNGIYRFTFDSKPEIARIAKAVPGGTVLLRLRLDNPDALVDLNQKFGVYQDQVLPLLKAAKEQGLDVAGLCFHVGSQTTTAKAYIEALKICRRLFDEATAEGFALRILDIGGGLPIPTFYESIDVGAMTAAIAKALNDYFPTTEIWAEPGRFICGTTVNLITRVIGSQFRNNQQWYILDEGIYGSFSGIIFDHWEFELETFKEGAQIHATFAGPSCDSIDVMVRDKLTVPLEVGDLLLTPVCGAYTSASATVFNGFAKAPIVVWEDVADEINK